MKRIDRALKKGDHVWVQPNNHWGDTLPLRIAEVLSVMRISVYNKDVPHATVIYRDGSEREYECISLDQIKGFCEEDEL